MTEDISSHLKKGKAYLETSEVINQKMGGNSAGNSKQIIEKANKHPDWLPEGWSVDLRTRKSGPNMGAGYKCYIEPLNGYKFYSKPEVLRYLNAHNGNGNNLKKKGCTVTHSPSNVAVEKSIVDNSLPRSTKEVKIAKSNNIINSHPVASDESVVADLPTEQIEEVKIGKSSNGIRKEACYTDPVNEYHSKMDGLRAESGDISTCLFKPNKGQIQDEDISTVMLENSAVDVLQPRSTKEAEGAIESSSVDDLPPGWTKKVKIRKNDSGIRKDPYYMDPVNGYVFRSKKDAWRYIESGDITKCLFKPTKRQIEDEDSTTLSSTAKRQKLKQPAAKRQLFVGRKVSVKNSIKLSDTNSSEKGHNVKLSTTETVVKMHSLEDATANTPERNKTSDPADVQVKNHVPGTLKNADEKNHRRPSISNKKGLNVANRFSRRLAGVEPDQVSDPNIVANEQALLVPKRSLRKGDLINKSSRISQGQGDSSEQSNHNSLSSDYNSPSLKGATKTTGEIGKLGAEEKRSSKKKVHIPHRASKRLAGFEPDITNSMLRGRPPEYKGKMSKVEANAESHQIEGTPAKKTAFASSFINVPRVGESSVRSKSSSKIPPRTCEQQEKLGEKLLDDEKSEPQLSFAFHYSWSDPSVEFAIKTLTGALPAENSVDKGPVLVPETDEVDKTRLSKNVTEDQGPVWVPEADEVDKTKLSKNVTEGQGPVSVPEADEVDKTKLSKNVTEGQGPVSVPEADTDEKTNLSKSVTKGSSDKNRHLTPKKSKNKKEPSFPRRLSKRLAGHEPEIAPADRAVEYASKKSCKDVLTAAATSGNGALEHIDVGEETQLDLQAPTSPKIVHGESSNESDKSNEVQIAPNEQLQKVEAEKVNEKSESEVSLPFGDSWSDPCFEFAIKTLTGALPVDGFEEILPVMTPDLNCPPDTGLLESVVEKCINEEAHDNVNKLQNNEDINKVCQHSKQQLDQPQSFTSSTSCENAPKFTTVESHGDDAKITSDLKQSQNNEDINKVCQLSKQVPEQPESFICFTSCENAPKFATVESHGGDANITRDLNQSQRSEDVNKFCLLSKQFPELSKQVPEQLESFISFTSCENAPKFATVESHGGDANITRDLNQSQNSEDVNKVCLLSKQFPELSKQLPDQPESFISSTSCANAPKFVTVESHGDDAKITRDLNQSQNNEDVNKVSQLSKQLPNQLESFISSTSYENAPKFSTIESHGDDCKIDRDLKQSQNCVDINEICQPSKQLLGQPEWFNLNAPKFATVKSHGDDAKITRDLNQSQNNEDVNKVSQLSKQLPNQPESFISSTSYENAPKFATIESHGDDCKIDRDLKQSQNCVDINEICQPSKQLLGQPEWLINSTSCEMICQPLKDLRGHPELRTSYASCENTPKFVAGEYHGHEAKITNNLDERASLNIGAANEFQVGHQSRNIGTSKVQESFNNIAQVLGQEFAAAKQPQLETRIENQDKSELQFSAPLMASWSDPCLEFAFKTLTGALPVEENLSFQGCFQEPANNFNSQKDASPMLPDFESPGLPRADISFHYNAKSMPGQQTSMNSSILPPERVSPHWFPGFDSQKHYSQSSKNSQGG